MLTWWHKCRQHWCKGFTKFIQFWHSSLHQFMLHCVTSSDARLTRQMGTHHSVHSTLVSVLMMWHKHQALLCIWMLWIWPCQSKICWYKAVLLINCMLGNGAVLLISMLGNGWGTSKCQSGGECDSKFARTEHEGSDWRGKLSHGVGFARDL